MELLESFKVMGILFAIIAIGFLSTRLEILKEEDTRVTSNIIMYISSPALIFNSVLLSFDKEFILRSASVPLFAIVMNLALIAISFFIVKILKLQNKIDIYTFSLSVAFSNTVFIGLPVILGLYGERVTGVVFLFDMGATLMFWILGVYFLNRNREGTNIKLLVSSIINPPLIAFLLAMLLGFTELNTPDVIMELTNMVGQITVPLSLLSIGITIGSINLSREFFDPSIILAVIMRLLISPILMMFTVRGLKVLPLIKKVLVMESAMPSVVMLTVLARRYDHGYEYSSIVVFITTLLSILTLPLIAYLIEIVL